MSDKRITVLNEKTTPAKASEEFAVTDKENPITETKRMDLVEFIRTHPLAMKYNGPWDADTNLPLLINGTGVNGDTYRVSDSGTQDLGDGDVDYSVGDLLIYSGSLGLWQKSPTASPASGPETYVELSATDPATDITGAQLQKLKNMSIADTLHVHYRSFPLHFKDRLKFKTAAYVESSQFIYEGTDNLPQTVNAEYKMLAFVENGSNVGKIRVVNKNDSDAVITEVLNITNTAVQIFTLVVDPNDLPATESIFGIQGANSETDDTSLVFLVGNFNRPTP